MNLLKITAIGAAALLLSAAGTLAQSRSDQTQLTGSSSEPPPTSGRSTARSSTWSGVPTR